MQRSQIGSGDLSTPTATRGSAPPEEPGVDVGPEDLVRVEILRRIEEQYWRPIQEATVLEVLLADRSFLADPGRHVGLYSDHGIVHVRDVAARAARLAAELHGLLIARRSAQRLRFVQGCAVVLAYMHDIGMTPANTAGRKVHSQFAAQSVFAEDFDPIAAELWATDAGGLRSRIEEVDAVAPFDVPRQLVAREVLALSMGHSKSAVPIHVLDEPVLLRRVIQRATFTRLDTQAAAPTSALIELGPDPTAPSNAVFRYTEHSFDPVSKSFAWLLGTHPATRAFVDDVIDAIRVLRAADALRRRGTTHRTSAGFEVCTDHERGCAVFAMRTADDRVSVLVRDDNPMSGAEANLRVIDLTPSGSLRIALHRAGFEPGETAQRVAQRLADVIIDIDLDALGSFHRPPVSSSAQMLIELVRPHDEPSFAELLRAQLVARQPSLSDRVVIVDEPHRAPLADLIDWTTRGEPLNVDASTASRLLEQLQAHGFNTRPIDRRTAFNGVRRTTVRAGEQVLAPHSAASAVLIPLGPGLVVFPTGGYPSCAHHPWLPMGVTGVVRRGERNASVTADRDVELIAIPADVFLSEWFRPYEVSELPEAASRWRP